MSATELTCAEQTRMLEERAKMLPAGYRLEACVGTANRYECVSPDGLRGWNIDGKAGDDDYPIEVLGSFVDDDIPGLFRVLPPEMFDRHLATVPA